MINDFAHQGLEDFFYDGVKKGIQGKHVQRLGLILDRLDAANQVRDMDYPGSALHPLKGKLKGFYSVKVSGNWRVLFRFERGHAYRVDYVDYH